MSLLRYRCFLCCLIVLPSIIYGIDLKDYLDRMAADNETINNAFELVPGGFLGEGSFAIVYKGIRISDTRPVAMKFVLKKNDKTMEQEYRMFTYLEAIDNEPVEKFGIPVVFYYGEFLNGNFIVMALSSFEHSLLEKANEGHFLKHPINSLILLKQFIITSKYIHSHGVRHDDVKPDNLMFRGHRSFLIDFNLSSKILQKKHGGTIEYYSRKVHSFQLRTPMDDLESFLYVLCEINFVKLKFLPSMGFDISDSLKAFRDAGEMKCKANDTIAEIKLAIHSPHLRRPFLAFAEHVLFSKNTIPDYDGMYQMVHEAIESMVTPLPAHFAFFTWLTDAEIAAAKEEVAKLPAPDIENALIRMPQFIDFANYPYPEPNFNKFGGLGLMSRVSSTFSSVMKSILD